MQHTQQFTDRIARGSFTYDPRRDVFIEPGSMDGYFVSLGGGTSLLWPEMFDGRALLKFYNKNFDALELSPDAPINFIGGWVSDGVLYLDVYRFVLDRDQALMLGASKGQISIFDIRAGRHIDLQPSQEAA